MKFLNEISSKDLFRNEAFFFKAKYLYVNLCQKLLTKFLNAISADFEIQSFLIYFKFKYKVTDELRFL